MDALKSRIRSRIGYLRQELGEKLDSSLHLSHEWTSFVGDIADLSFALDRAVEETKNLRANIANQIDARLEEDIETNG